MPPNNNSNSTSVLSRQMQRLRQQVDRIDLKMLRLLQQRTKLSGQIGQMKRRHGGVIYVPERERELVARLTRLSKGQPPARAVAALYREIMSSSRAAQGQTRRSPGRERRPGSARQHRVLWCVRSIRTQKIMGRSSAKGMKEGTLRWRIDRAGSRRGADFPMATRVPQAVRGHRRFHAAA